MDTTTQENNYI